MEGLANILVGLAALAALAIAVLAHDWRDESRDRMLRRRSHAGMARYANGGFGIDTERPAYEWSFPNG